MLIVKKGHLKQRAAAGVIIKTMHEAKQELAEELEANLKQLKAVLETTQRIARELEAVLKEAKAEPDKEASTGRPKPSWEAAQRQDTWRPPGVREPDPGAGQRGPEEWRPPGIKRESADPGEPEPWQVPHEAEQEEHPAH